MKFSPFLGSWIFAKSWISFRKVAYPGIQLMTERDRKQQVHANGVASDTRFISTGVRQWSILGPLLFTIFINDLPKSSNFFSTGLYADDTSLIASGSDLDSLLRKINNHLPAVYEWLCSNKLTLNLTKTKFLICMPRQKESFKLYPPLTVANLHLEKSFCVKYLGLSIDCQPYLAWPYWLHMWQN